MNPNLNGEFKRPHKVDRVRIKTKKTIKRQKYGKITSNINRGSFDLSKDPSVENDSKKDNSEKNQGWPEVSEEEVKRVNEASNEFMKKVSET